MTEQANVLMERIVNGRMAFQAVSFFFRRPGRPPYGRMTHRSLLYTLTAICAAGLWFSAARAGYEVIRVPQKNGKATGEYEDFVTGFVTPDGQVWGRPVGVAVGPDGSLFVTDDGSKSIWRVSYAK